jgi:hypothetical protein
MAMDFVALSNLRGKSRANPNQLTGYLKGNVASFHPLQTFAGLAKVPEQGE